MMFRPGKAVAFSLLALHFSSCAPMPLAEKPAAMAFKPAANVEAGFAPSGLAEPRARRLAERLLQDGKIAAIPGIVALMESMPGRCALHDLCSVKGEKAQVRKARNLFTLLCAIEEDFLSEFGLLKGFGKPPEERLGGACSAFMSAMEINNVRAEPGVGFLSGLGAMYPKADCDVSGIIFIHLARLAGIDAIGAKIGPSGGMSGHFLAAVRMNGKIAAMVETTALLSRCRSTYTYAPSANEAVLSPSQWNETRGKGYAGREFCYLTGAEIVIMYTCGTEVGFGKAIL